MLHKDLISQSSTESKEGRRLNITPKVCLYNKKNEIFEISFIKNICKRETKPCKVQPLNVFLGHCSLVNALGFMARKVFSEIHKGHCVLKCVSTSHTP